MQDYQKHVRQSHEARKNTPYCGVTLSRSEWAFEGADHLLNTLESEGRLTGCPKCINAIKIILNSNQ